VFKSDWENGKIEKRATKKEKQMTDSKPLFAMTASEFMLLVQEMVKKTVSEMTSGVRVNEQSEKDETFNIGQCAEFLKCTKMSVHNYKKKGLPFYKMGRTILFKKSEVLEFMKNFTSVSKIWKKRK
jgi:excisionase family DNA binding protein